MCFSFCPYIYVNPLRRRYFVSLYYKFECEFIFSNLTFNPIDLHQFNHEGKFTHMGKIPTWANVCMHTRFGDNMTRVNSKCFIVSA